MSHKLKLRILVVGDPKTGKTSFIKKYLDSNSNIDVNSTTYGAEAYIKEIDYCEGLKLELDIWDTYAGDKYSGLSNLFTRNAKGCFIITDINDDNGFDEAEQWLKALRDKTTQISQSNNTKVPIFLIGNKSDKITDDFAFEEAERNINSKAYSMDFDNGMLVSCAENYNIQQAFDLMIKQIDVMGLLKSQKEVKDSATHSETKTLSKTSFFSSRANHKAKCCA